MNSIPFEELNLIPEIRRAVEALGFETATDIQSQSIPLIQSGRDVIGRSQTGTGKTLAFGVPALEIIDPATVSYTHLVFPLGCHGHQLLFVCHVSIVAHAPRQVLREAVEILKVSCPFI